MFSRKVFAERLILLKTVHNINNGQIADILKLKSRSTVNNLENQETSPSVELLIDIADFFAVSTDWLSGQSEQPYNLSQLENLEHELYQCLNTGLTDHPERQFFYYAKIHSLQSNTYYFRKENIAMMGQFCPAARANIIFALRVLLYASEKYYNDGHNLDYNLPTLLHNILNEKAVKGSEKGALSILNKTSNLLHTIFSMGKKTEKALAELCHFCYFDVLEYYWHPLPKYSLKGTYRNEIIFDITKKPQTLKELDAKIDYFSKNEVNIY